MTSDPKLVSIPYYKNASYRKNCASTITVDFGSRSLKVIGNNTLCDIPHMIGIYPA